MSEFSDLVEQLKLAPGADPAERHAALLATLWRMDHRSHLSAEEAHEYLQMLGLVPSEDGGKYRAFGQRESQTKRIRRRPAADPAPS